MAINDDLLLDILQETDAPNQSGSIDSAEREELEALLAVYHLSALSENAQSQKLEPMPDSLQHIVQTEGEALISTALSDKVVPIKAKSKAHSVWPQNIAIAACLLLAMVAWYPRVIEQFKTPETIEQTLANFSSDANTVSLAWQATEDKAALDAQGQVLWNQGSQKGYMRFKGLAVNQSDEYQYQLWIFDKSRDADNGHPVDGGVFDISDSDTETIVPINAKLGVDKPYLFAVTIEKPGGVVVSKQERIVLLAKPQALLKS